jgi:hypothetical protein
MARLLLISVPDNAHAEDFINAVNNGDVIFSTSVVVPDSDDPGEVRYVPLLAPKVEAVWGLPTQFCECPDYPGSSVPTAKMRWMVHSRCAKPRKGANQNPRDLLRPDARPGEVPYYIGFRAGIDMFGYARTPRS